ncbi:MAG: phage holin family protein [Sphingomonadales bacterium]|nr:phage holin family protein [Sphingomonadales bacterium]
MSDPEADLEEKAAPPPPDDGSVRASITRLVASGRELAEAELAWAKLKAAVIADGLRRWLILATLAMIFLVMGVVILIASAIIALAPAIGLLLASLIVAGSAILLAAIFALRARRTFLKLFEEDAAP